VADLVPIGNAHLDGEIGGGVGGRCRSGQHRRHRDHDGNDRSGTQPRSHRLQVSCHVLQTSEDAGSFRIVV
jgi:hypothetical protein